MSRTDRASVRIGMMVVAAWLVAGCGGVPVRREGSQVPRLRQVTSALWVGGQPSADGLRDLRERGVSVVISVRADDATAAAEATLCRQAGLRFQWLPLSWHGAPDREQSLRILRAIEATRNAGETVFVHCCYGRDRTGALVALYRMAEDGWTMEQAWREASKNGVIALTWSLKPWLAEMQTAIMPQPSSLPSTSSAQR